LREAGEGGDERLMGQDARTRLFLAWHVRTSQTVVVERNALAKYAWEGLPTHKRIIALKTGTNRKA
jgi:hypothetical protein